MNRRGLRAIVEIQAKTERNEIDDLPTDQWAEVCKQRALIRPLSSRELQAMSAVHSTATHNIVTPYVEGHSPAWRLVHRGDVYNVLGVNRLPGRNGDLQWVCNREA